MNNANRTTDQHHQPAGPEELLRLKADYLVPCVYHFYKRPPQIVSGQGCWLYDHTGRRYLDCYSGVAVMSAGHCNPAIIEPVVEQIRRLQHTTSIYLTEPALRLAEKIAQIAPAGLRRSFFCASGTEAVEGALLSACLHTGRAEIVAMCHGLHGRTRWAMNVTGLDVWRTDPFPLAAIHHLPFGDVAAVEALLSERGQRVAAVIGEPVQGNGGINIPSAEYWPRVRRLCRDHGVLLVLDEVQTGFGRTGRWFACEHWAIAPDIMTMSKALGNGFPIAAFTTTDEVAASYTRPGASTYGGNPVCAAAALAVIAYHQEHRLAERAAALGADLLAALQELCRRHSGLTRPRGLGLMCGADVVDAAGRAAPQILDALLEDLKDRGVLCGKTGPDRNVLTFMPPLTIDHEQIDTLVHTLDQALSSIEVK